MQLWNTQGTLVFADLCMIIAIILWRLLAHRPQSALMTGFISLNVVITQSLRRFMNVVDSLHIGNGVV